MPGYQKRHQTIFTTLHSEGAILPMDLLQRIAQGDANLQGLTPESYHLLKTEKLNEAINRSWNRLLSAWTAFKAAREKLPEHDTGTTLTRERWLLTLFYELGYGRLLTSKPIEVNDRSYSISHGWQNTSIHLVSFKVKLDEYTRTTAGNFRSSPHSLMQELLNRSDTHLWGLVSNGLRMRILRDNVSLTRQAYVEFDLEAMMDGEVYADFVLLWLLCHQSRVEAEKPEECWLEKWSRAAHEQGIRALDQLRNGVEQAITSLGSGFLAPAANNTLRERLRSGELNAQDYYRQILRLVYRLLVLFVAEDREILFHPDADLVARERYTLYYSTTRLRRLAEQRIGTRHADLFHGLRLVLEKLGDEMGCAELGIPALDSFLFSREAISDLADCEIANHDLLDAIRSLAFIDDRRMRRAVDYKNLGSEELGSVYESLLELHPVLHIDAARFELQTAGGHERKTTGSYYTPTSLITCLLDSALDPVLDEACAKPDAEAAILNLKICDPACGSGHFLIAASHRVAKRLAASRTGEEEPAPEARRKALRDVVGRCIYGVDINPMAVELCKVSLWMEAIEPGKPLSFLEQHIQCGNSLLGATPALLEKGIPDSAFEPIEGDDKNICREYKKKNKLQREGNRTLFDPEGNPWERLGDFATSMMQLEEMGDDTVEEIRRKQEYYNKLVHSNGYLFGRLWADAWCASFVWKKNNEFAYPITEEAFRNIEKNPYSISTWMRDEIIRLREQYQFFHWHLAFPGVFRVPKKDEMSENEQAGWSGGFDVVLGNPPWEKIKIQEKEWFASHRPDIVNAVNAAARRHMIEELLGEDPILHTTFLDAHRLAEGESHFVRHSGRYPLCGKGDVNTYAIFAESMRLIINPIGRIGCIVPSGIVADDTTKTFFQDLMQARSLVSLYDFENSKNLFPGVGHGVFKFSLLTLTGSLRPLVQSADFVFFANGTEVLSEVGRHFSLSKQDLALLNPNTLTCPIFRSNHDCEITKTIYAKVPILIKESPFKENLWEIKLFRMFDMTNDAHLFRTREELEAESWILKGNYFYKDEAVYIPLYESKLTHQFNHRAATFDNIPFSQRFKLHAGTNSAALRELCNPNFTVIPRYWIPESEVQTYSQNHAQWFLGFRNAISAVADARSLVATIIPYAGVGNSMPVLRFESGLMKAAILLAAMNSFVLDYIVRQKASGGNLNFYVFYQLPFPHPNEFAQFTRWSDGTLTKWILSRVLELTYTAWDLEGFAKDCGYNGPPFQWDLERRFILRCELDAAYFHLYRIERDNVDHIMETFPVVKREDEKQHGEYRTKRVILEMYDEMRRAMETGEVYRTRLVPGPADGSVADEGRIGVEA
jgi:hypothetical protein